MSDLPKSSLLAATEVREHHDDDGNINDVDGYELQATKAAYETKRESSEPPSHGDLQKSALQLFLRVSVDICSILAWLGMLFYATLLWRFSGVLVQDIPVSAAGLVAAAKPLSTLFSILFAATFGRASTSIAHWLLEKGGKVGFLDQLIKTSSVSTALMKSYSSGMYGQRPTQALAIVMAFLWLLSPLGSQAVLRVPSIRGDPVRETITLQYLNTSHWDDLSGSADDGQLTLIAPDTLLNAALISSPSSKQSHRDAWGHVKIPILESMPSSSNDPNAWRDIRNGSISDFSSLTGLPIDLLSAPIDQTTNISLESWYWNLNCDPWVANGVKSSFPYNTSEGYSVMEAYDNPATVIAWNETEEGGGNRATEACDQSFVDAPTIVDCPELPIRKIWIEINGGASPISAMCQVTVTYVETEVHCLGQDCSAKRIRKSQQPHHSAGWTPLDVWTGNSTLGFTVPSLFLTNLANVVAGRNYDSGGSNALAGYIADPSNPYAINSYGSGTALPDLQEILSDDAITSRYAQFLNTYWIASVGQQLVTGTNETWNQAVNLTYRFASGRHSSDSESNSGIVPTLIIADAVAQQTTVEDKLFCNKAWLSALTFIIFVALASSIASVVFVLLYSGPRLTMDVTTLLRDNQYGGLPKVGSYLDDDQRQRLLNDVTVRIGDVKPYDHVGHVALVAVNTSRDTAGVGRLKKNKLYD